MKKAAMLFASIILISCHKKEEMVRERNEEILSKRMEEAEQETKRANEKLEAARKSAPLPAPPKETAPNYTFSQSNVDQFCTEEWTKRGSLNKSMFSYCVRTQKEGHKRLQSTITKYHEMDWFDDLLSNIWNKWTKRGITDYNEVAYIIDRECDNFLTVTYERNQPNSDKEKIDECVKEARYTFPDSRWSMAVYCLKKQ